MKINDKILNIPPHISTSWNNVSSIHLEDNVLIITLKSSEKVKIPNLEKKILDEIFLSHEKYMEKPTTKIGFSMPMSIGGEPIDGIDQSLGSMMMQHNPAQSDAPDIPKEILEKIVSISKIVGAYDDATSMKPHTNCNCMYCQVARAINGDKKEADIEEPVADDELKFRTWDIEQTGEKLYCVTNPLDKNEHYSVFLGKPIGCTCGKKNCEHIKAVLTS